MHHEVLAKLFKKFKKEELVEVLVERGLLDGSFREKSSGTKAAVVKRLVKVVGGKFTERYLAMMDLIYHQVHSKTKKWDVYHMVGFDPIKSKASVLSDPSVFEAKLHKQLKLYFKMNVCVQQLKTALWMRLAIHNTKTPMSSTAPSSIVYMVHYPHSPYVITTNIRAAHKPFIFQALADVLSCETAQKMSLTGKDVPSLADLVLNRHSQGAFSQYRLNQIDANPLISHRKRRRQDNILDPSTVCSENRSEETSRLKVMADGFGNNPQPILEKVEFRMHTRFRGTQYVAHHKKPFRCSAKFEGPSVIEGIKALGTAGIASLPLPSHLANLHSLSRSNFLLTDRKRVKRLAYIQDENSKPSTADTSVSSQ